MAYQLTPKLRDLTPYDPIQGDYPIRLDANESFISLPNTLRREIALAVENLAFNRYPDPCCKELCQAFGEYYGINPALVTAGNGSDELISLLMNSFFAKGERVLTLAPDFSMYKFYIALAELEHVSYAKGADLNLDVDDLIEFIRQNHIAGLIFSNPCNPTSQGLGREEILRLVANVDCLVILDEAYMDFWEGSLLDRIEDFPNLMILRTCSKAMGMAAVRLGFAVAGSVLTRGMRAAKSPYNVNTISQIAGKVVLSNREYLQDCVKKIQNSREELYQGLLALQEKKTAIIKIFQPVTNFVFLKTADNQKVFHQLLRKGIAIRYMGEYLRITAGNPRENTAVLTALEELL